MVWANKERFTADQMFWFANIPMIAMGYSGDCMLILDAYNIG
jgi:hypothetical protein